MTALDLRPAERPRCPQHGSFMRLRLACTKEQAFCGTWYECAHHGPVPCKTTVLLISPALQAQLDEQARACVAAK